MYELSADDVERVREQIEALARMNEITTDEAADLMVRNLTGHTPPIRLRGPL